MSVTMTRRKLLKAPDQRSIEIPNPPPTNVTRRGVPRPTGRSAASKLHAYRITGPGHDALVVFAESVGGAAQLAIEWQGLNGVDATPITIDVTWPRELSVSQQAELQDALSWGHVGIGSFRPDGGWGVMVPRDERDFSW
jgi:hypothetical protein